MPPSKKSMSKTRQLSALVNFVSCLRANRVKAKTRAFMRWRLNLEASRAAAAERLALARVGLAHGAGRAGEPDPIRALLVVIASSDGFAQAQRTPSRKSLRDFSPPSPMAALQL